MPKKLPKQAVNYRSARTRQRRCANCVMFRPPAACTLVAGEIRPEGLCDRWEAKLTS